MLVWIYSGSLNVSVYIAFVCVFSARDWPQDPTRTKHPLPLNNPTPNPRPAHFYRQAGGQSWSDCQARLCLWYKPSKKHQLHLPVWNSEETGDSRRVPHGQSGVTKKEVPTASYFIPWCGPHWRGQGFWLHLAERSELETITDFWWEG